MVPPAQPCRGGRLDSGVPPTTGCPYGKGNPCHRRAPPGQTAEDHRPQLGPPLACKDDAEQTPTPCSSPQAHQSLESSTPQNSRPAPTLGLPQPLACVSCPTPIQAPTIAAPLSVGIPPWSHTSPASTPASPLAPICACVCTYPPIPYLCRKAGLHRCDPAGVCKHGHVGAVPWDAPCSTDPSLGTVCCKGEGLSPVRTCYGAERGDPSVSPEPHLYLHTSTPAWIFPPTLFSARAVIALIGIGGSEQLHPGPPPFRVAGGLLKLRLQCQIPALSPMRIS